MKAVSTKSFLSNEWGHLDIPERGFANPCAMCFQSKAPISRSPIQQVAGVEVRICLRLVWFLFHLSYFFLPILRFGSCCIP